jgi:NTP pyrophosphatase (non-canonical NTP hydrolase)
MSYPSYDLTINRLFEMNVSRCLKWHPNGGIQSWSPLEWSGAMCGESGEAANAAKKLKRLTCDMQSINEGSRHITTIEVAQHEVAKECADTILYALLLMKSVGVENPESIIREVFNKKSVEYGFPEVV